VRGGELEYAIEDKAAATGSAAVEAEDELIEVAGQVGLFHRALVGAEQPPLDERSHAVHAGQ
jgi:hypothetical protein